MTPDKAWIESAILIYGPRKAGTTLFQNLLDGGEDLFVYPTELKLKYLSKNVYLTPREYFSLSRIPWVKSTHFQTEKYKHKWHEENEAKSSVADLIRTDIITVFQCSKAWLKPPRMWCAKEVGGKPMQITKFWRELFPNSRIIFVVRNPSMVTRAVLQDRRRKGRSLSVWEIIKQTYEPIAIVASIKRMIDEKHVFTISYEELVTDTRATMRRLAEWLDISYGQFLTSPSIFGEEVIVRTSSRAEKKVFVSKAKWMEGLTMRERIIVFVTGKLVKLIPRCRLQYEAFRQSLK
jgi:hypothetical protein